MVVKLKIDNQREWYSLYWALREAGLLERMTVNEMTFPLNCYPLEIPVDVDALLKLVKSPAVKPFRKMIDYTLTENLRKVKPSLV